MSGNDRASLPAFLTKAADQVHVAFMPDTAWPIIEHPPDSSRNYQLGSGFDAT
jgi:hypothetical protein